MLLPVALAFNCVAWPSTVGPLFDADRPPTGTSCTVTVTSSGALPRPTVLVTTRRKVSVAGAAGAVKVGCAAPTLLSATAGPLSCCQR